MKSTMRIATAAALAIASLEATAHAYCRTTSCMSGMPHTAAVCTPPQPDDCGVPLFWSKPCVQYDVQQDGSPKLGISAEQLDMLMATAFSQWTDAACMGGGHPLMAVTQGPEVACHQHEYNQTSGNANVIMFHDDSWPYEGSPNTLALTTVTYNLDTGEIYDADMELNSADNPFTIGDTNVDFDLLSIVTHESGHFLGLAHSHDPAATMWPEYMHGTTNLRHISPDDVAAICATYPPGPAPASCDTTPRHGFSGLCAAQQTHNSSCCAVAVGSGGPGRRDAASLAAIGALALVVRSSKRRRRG
jgi:hypothetical protein